MIYSNELIFNLDTTLSELIFYSIYLISSIIILILFVFKSFKFIKSNNINNNSVLSVFIGQCVKYINCVIIPYIISIIIPLILYFNKNISKKNNKLSYSIIHIIQCNISMWFFHLQLDHYNEIYKLFCDPCRIEIKYMIARMFGNINLPSLSSSKSNDNISSNSNDSDSSTQSSLSTTLHGAEPTRSDNINNANRLQFDDGDYDGITGKKIFIICHVCPLFSDSVKRRHAT